VKSKTAPGEWTDKFGRKRTPQQMFIADDGTVTHGAEAIAAFSAHIDHVQALRRRALRGVSRGHAPREARNDHHRGSRRGDRATSSSSDDPDPEPPAARPCACGCGRPRRPGSNYFDDECRKRHARERKRVQRRRDRENPDRVVERDTARGLYGMPAKPCDCNGRHIVLADWPGHCVRCGHDRPAEEVLA
jgi:hypothetical protein